MTRRSCLFPLTVLLALATSAFTGWSAGLKVEGLKCEYRVNPLGLDTAQPRLSWLLESPERGERQTAYQVLAATTKELLAKGSGDLWDSGKVSSSASVQVEIGRASCR